jgi:hypothetical protein
MSMLKESTNFKTCKVFEIVGYSKCLKNRICCYFLCTSKSNHESVSNLMSWRCSRWNYKTWVHNYLEVLSWNAVSLCDREQFLACKMEILYNWWLTPILEHLKCSIKIIYWTVKWASLRLWVHTSVVEKKNPSMSLVFMNPESTAATRLSWICYERLQSDQDCCADCDPRNSSKGTRKQRGVHWLGKKDFKLWQPQVTKESHTVLNLRSHAMFWVKP